MWKTVGRIVSAPVRVPARLVKTGLERKMAGLIATVVARQLITMIGGGVAGAGEGELVSTLSGALAALGGVAWSLYENRGDTVWTRERIFGLVRHCLTGLGGVYVGQGVVTGQAVDAGAGGLVTAVTILWSLYEKRRTTIDTQAIPPAPPAGV